MWLAIKQLHACQALQRDDVAGQGALRNEQSVGRSGEASMLRHAFERPAKRIQREPASCHDCLLHHEALPQCRATVPQSPEGHAAVFAIVASRRGTDSIPMPFFDVGSQFLGFNWVGAGTGEIRRQIGHIAPSLLAPMTTHYDSIGFHGSSRAPARSASIGAVVAELVPSGSAVLLVCRSGLAGYRNDRYSPCERSYRRGWASCSSNAEKQTPPWPRVDAAAEQARCAKRRCAVVSIGGGSALDVGKTVAAICGASSGASHYGLCANAFPKSTVVNLCVPTTSGTGSETTRTAVLADANHAKIWLWGEEIKADVVILDPVLTTGLPAHLTAAQRALTRWSTRSKRQPMQTPIRRTTSTPMRRSDSW